MNRLKILGVVFTGLFLLLSIWYLFVKSNDFDIVIHAKTSPGTIYQSVLDWNTGLNKGDVSTVILKKRAFSQIVHTYIYESIQLEMDWTIIGVNDSISTVTIGVTDLNNSVRTRLHKLFASTPIEELIQQEFTGFNAMLISHLDEFDVKIIGREDTPERYVAYVNVSCFHDQKAAQMINNSTYINSFLQDNEIDLISNPFLEILEWNTNTGQLNFNFCFPINHRIDFPKHKTIKYKKVSSKKSLKATFHGNYSFTDKAWFALYAYVEDKPIVPLHTITEIFLENPHTTAEKDISWEAAIYLEIE